MTRTISADTIHAYGASPDRTDHFDDRQELTRFARLLTDAPHLLGAPSRDGYIVRTKPFGDYGVDLGVFADDTLVCAFDLERCLTWRDDWPAHWRGLSFLSRKDRYLTYPQFGMVWTNAAVTTCVVAWKDAIAAAPVVTRRFAGRTYTDAVREVPFRHGMLIGNTFGPREQACFTHRLVYQFISADR